MKYTVKKRFDNVKIGEKFMWYGNKYLRIFPIKDEAGDTWTALNLQTYSVALFYNEDWVFVRGKK